jgi:DNA-binding response OmpR family regulator
MPYACPQSALKQGVLYVPTIIAINNSADLLNIMRERLMEHGFTVYLGHPTGETYDLIHKLQQDLIILDLASQDANAYKLFKQLRKDRQRSHFPMIVMLAPWQQEEFTQLAGTNDDSIVLVKPFSLPDLLCAIERALPDSILPQSFSSAG